MTLALAAVAGCDATHCDRVGKMKFFFLLVRDDLWFLILDHHHHPVHAMHRYASYRGRPFERVIHTVAESINAESGCACGMCNMCCAEERNKKLEFEQVVMDPW